MEKTRNRETGALVKPEVIIVAGEAEAVVCALFVNWWTESGMGGSSSEVLAELPGGGKSRA